jgi:hypothetical protein
MRRFGIVALTMALVTAVMLVAAPVALPAAGGYDWKDAHGPGNGDANALAYDGARDIVYRATGSHGVLKYSGGAWTSLGGGQFYTWCSLAYDQAHNILYAGTEEKGSWRCDNPDTRPSWTQLGGALSNSAAGCMFFQASSDALYVGTGISARGVWRCDSPGSSPSWTDISGPVRAYEIYALAYDPSRDILYAGGGGSTPPIPGVWQCTDPDVSPLWIYKGAADVSPFIYSLVYDVSRDCLYAGTYISGVYSCDHPTASSTWVYNGMDGYSVYSLVHDQSRDILYAGTVYGGVWCGADAHTAPSWYDMGGVTGAYVTAVGYDQIHDVLYAGTFGEGVWKCVTPEGKPLWSDTGGGLSNSSVLCLLRDPTRDTLYVGGMDDGIWRCDHPDGAPAWTAIGGPIADCEPTAMAYDPVRDVLYAGVAASDTRKGVWRCLNPDGSASWTQLDTYGGSAVYSLGVDSLHNILYAGTNGAGVWRCPDPDTSSAWASMGGATGGFVIYSLACDQQRNVLYAGCDNHGVWRCPDPGASNTWSSTGGALSGSAVWSVCLDTARDMLYCGTYQQGVWRCARPDGPASWSDTGLPMPDADVRAIEYDGSRNVVFGGTFGQGVWRCAKPDTAPSWADTGGRVSELQFNSMACDEVGDFVYAGTRGAGVWYSAVPASGAAIASCSPGSGSPGQTLDVSITGGDTNFSSGASAAVFSGTGITVNSTTVKSATSATASITIGPDAAQGSREVNVITGAEVPEGLRAGFSVSSPTWYLAEGSTAWGFDTYVTVTNPNQQRVDARITYMTDSGPVDGGTFTMVPMSQLTVNPSDVLGSEDFSTKVQCLQGRPIAADRTMSWRREAHSSIGVSYPSSTWCMPEGCSAFGFETWLLVQNPNPAPATCDITYMIEGGTAVTRTHTIPGNSRRSFNMADDIGAQNASIQVASSIPVIAERSVYRDERVEGSCSIGAVAPAQDFFLAEGTTAWGFKTWLLVQNPGAEDAQVGVTYITPGGPVEQAPFKVPARSRKTVEVNAVPGVSNTDCSIKVHGSVPVVAERAMYWNNGTKDACHDSIGIASPHHACCLPDGQTSGGRETYTLVANPNSTAVTVVVTYMTHDGQGDVTFSDRIPANSRTTYDMSRWIKGERASIKVSCAANPIIVERSMYWDGRGAGTGTIGSYSD